MKYKTMPGVILTEICGNSYLVSADRTIQVNETTSFCWKQLEKGVDTETLFLQVQEHYEVEDTEMLKSDVTSLIDSLYSRRLIVRCGQ